MGINKAFREYCRGSEDILIFFKLSAILIIPYFQLFFPNAWGFQEYNWLDFEFCISVTNFKKIKILGTNGLRYKCKNCTFKVITSTVSYDPL